MYKHTITIEGSDDRHLPTKLCVDIDCLVSINFAGEPGYRTFRVTNISEEDLDPAPRMGFNEWW